VHAEMLSRSLIENRLAACVQIMPIKSFYEWKGEICKEEERLLLIKTKSSLYPGIEDLILKNHPYEVPEILMVHSTGGLEKYLTWIETVCR
jgi:periplasmic divalent cation tolerance protein